MAEQSATGIRVRAATVADEVAVRALYLCAFAAEEAGQVAALALELLRGHEAQSGFALVAEASGQVVGHVAFSPVRLREDASWKGSILAPLAVLPDQQGRGVGDALVREGLAQLRAAGAKACFVYGDPAYYGRFGFATEVALPFTPPHELSYPTGWLGLALTAPGEAEARGTLSCVEVLDDASLW